jgi:hypothetical protein
MLAMVCGGSVLAFEGSASAGSPPSEGLTALGWYGGIIVFTAYPSGVRAASLFLNFGAPSRADSFEFASCCNEMPSASSSANASSFSFSLALG